MGKKDDRLGSHIIISSADFGVVWKLLLFGSVSFLSAIGVITERGYSSVTEREIASVVQGQEDIRRSNETLSDRLDQCESRGRAFQAYIESSDPKKVRRYGGW